MNMRKAVVIGAGNMGASIAAHLAGAGMEVALLDMVPRELAEDEGKKGLTLESRAVRNRIAAAGKARVTDPKSPIIYAKGLADLITVGNLEDDLETVKDADWVVEAIVEQLQPKVDLFRRVSALAPEHCVLSSNTSGISITAIAEQLEPEKRRRFIGTHFFNPPRVMKLVEIVPTQYTEDGLAEEFREFATVRLGKSAIIASDTPNFISNRIGVCNSSLVINGLERFGLSAAMIDYLSGPLLNRPTGCLRMCDLCGNDVVQLTMATNEGAEADPAERALMATPDYYAKMIKDGQVGDKAGRGYYTKTARPERKSMMWDWRSGSYVEKPRAVPAALANVDARASSGEKIRAVLEGGGEEAAFLWYLLKHLLAYSARRVPEIAADFRKIDLAMQLGYNWELGPFELWQEIGVPYINQRLQTEGVELPAWVAEHLAAHGGEFYDGQGFGGLVIPAVNLDSPERKVHYQSESFRLVDLGDGIGCLLINTPNATLTVPASREMGPIIALAETVFDGLVLTNTKSSFCVGADLGDFIDVYDSGEWHTMEQNVRDFQAMTQAVKYAKIPIVAAPYGNVMGGGAELCLHAHRVVAHAELKIGLVEARLGLVPAGGGLKELVVRMAELSRQWPELHMELVLQRLAQYAIGSKVTQSAFEAREMGLLRSGDRIVLNRDLLLKEAKREALHLAKGFAPVVKNPLPVLGTTGFAVISSPTYNRWCGKFISDHDRLVADKIARVLTGGVCPEGTMVTEEELLHLERSAFLELSKTEKTQERVRAMAEGKRVAN